MNSLVRNRVGSGWLPCASHFSTAKVLCAKTQSKRPRGIPEKNPEDSGSATTHHEQSLDDMELDYTSTDKTVINITDPKYKERIGLLEPIFPRKDLRQLATRCPQIFVQPFPDIWNIVKYVSSVMGLNQYHMVKAGVFDYPFEHIVRRHTFAQRCGVFQRVPEKKPELAYLNPSLTSMMRSSDRDFVRLMGLTREEYDVFSDMFDLIDKSRIGEPKDDPGNQKRKRGRMNLVREEEDPDDLDEDGPDDNEDYLL